MAQYWLLDWLDSEGVKNVKDARKLLTEPNGVKRLIERAKMEAHKQVSAFPEAAEQVVAGPGFDLSGQFSCSNSPCLLKGVDVLIGRTWHYFDKVVATGLDPWRLLARLHDRQQSDEKLTNFTLNHIEVAFHVRNIGAESTILFSKKPAYCADHMDELAKQIGLHGGLTRMRDELAEYLRPGAKVEVVSRTPEKIIAVITHHQLETAQIFTYRPDPSNEELREFSEYTAVEKWSQRAAQNRAKALIENTALAKLNDAALGQAQSFDSQYRRYTKQRSSEISPADVALNVTLPLPEGISAREIIALRSHHAADFAAFQLAIRKAIKEKASAATGTNATKIADEIFDDLIQPALINIDRKITSATESLAKRSAVAIAIGSAVTTIGLLAFSPLVVPGIVVGAGGILTNAYDHIKSRQEIKLSDMYFLWHLSARASKHA
ncbi:hypothetical protein [Amycolatopsis sp. NPDC059021]|uniref:hypothetical protein n=1 Tax=Amycolatopsis sp. NPDC059021 TaxID=3346704 RepID=UPI00366E0D33